MIKVVNKFFLVFFYVIFLLSCTQKKTVDDTPRIFFNSLNEIELGDSLKVGKQFTKLIEFTNTGLKPLNILDIKASCGCTIVSVPKKTIESGEKGFIKISIKPEEVGVFDKTLILESNTNPPLVVVYLKGNTLN